MTYISRNPRAQCARKLLLALLLAGGLGCQGASADQDSLPVNESVAGGVVCLEPQHYAGWVREGSFVSHAFQLTNGGDFARNIISIKKNCSCLDAKASVQVIEPGSTCDVQVSLNVGRAKDISTTSAEVYFAGVEHPITLELAARVRPFLQVVPGSLDFGRLDFSDRTSRTLRVEQTSPEAPILERVEARPDALVVSMHCLTRTPPHTWEVTVALKGEELASQLDGQVLLIRSDGGVTAIPVRAQAGWGIEVRPSRPVLVFGGGTGSRQVTLRSRDGLPFFIADVRCSPSFLEVRAASGNEPNVMHQLVLTANPPSGTEAEFGEGAIVVTLRTPSGAGPVTSELEIPVSVVHLSGSAIREVRHERERLNRQTR